MNFNHLISDNSSLKQFIKLMNAYGEKREPFFFLIDFEMKKPVLFLLKEISNNDILYDINGNLNLSAENKRIKITLRKTPMLKQDYSKAFEIVQKALHAGYTYCINLTGRTKIECDYNLRDIFLNSKAKYKVWFNNEFVCFSPETFVSIKENIITACPMKGTIDASIPNAEEVILNNVKEKAEHDTIVDLLRNDLSIIAGDIKVTNYRYIEKIISGDKELLQVSSAISGRLAKDYNLRLGDIIFSLLPAGSVSGAPKKATLEIIRKAELAPRGYYTGICGIFDGINLDCGVMIRFIQNDNGTYYFRSGGGITAMSNLEEEYQELINKVYVPFN